MAEKLKERLKMSRFKSAEQEALLNLLVAAYYVRGEGDKAVARYGITMAQYNILRILNGVYPGGHPRCEIISRMIEPAPDVTRILDRLVEKGLVSRSVSAEDKRFSIASITKKGIALLEKMNEEVSSFDDFLRGKLTPSELEALGTICEKIYP